MQFGAMPDRFMRQMIKVGKSQARPCGKLPCFTTLSFATRAEDKANFVRPLAEVLSTDNLVIWYDGSR